MRKNSSNTIVLIGSILLLLLGIFHMAFWNLFDWKHELDKLSQNNNGIVQMMNICMITYFLSMSFIMFICRFEITDSKIGRLLLLSLPFFFFVRFILEFIFPGGSIILGGALLLLVIIFAFPVFGRNALSK